MSIRTKNTEFTTLIKIEIRLEEYTKIEKNTHFFIGFHFIYVFQQVSSHYLVSFLWFELIPKNIKNKLIVFIL